MFSVQNNEDDVFEEAIPYLKMNDTLYWSRAVCMDRFVSCYKERMRVRGHVSMGHDTAEYVLYLLLTRPPGMTLNQIAKLTVLVYRDGVMDRNRSAGWMALGIGGTESNPILESIQLCGEVMKDEKDAESNLVLQAIQTGIGPVGCRGVDSSEMNLLPPKMNESPPAYLTIDQLTIDQLTTLLNSIHSGAKDAHLNIGPCKTL
jgi:hypothetical protein